GGFIALITKDGMSKAFKSRNFSISASTVSSAGCPSIIDLDSAFTHVCGLYLTNELSKNIPRKWRENSDTSFPWTGTMAYVGFPQPPAREGSTLIGSLTAFCVSFAVKPFALAFKNSSPNSSRPAGSIAKLSNFTYDLPQ